MKSLRTLGLSTLALVLAAAPVLAAINSKISSASHSLEEYAIELHDHMHHAYGPSYGAHGVETTATDLHAVAHDYNHGEATEAEVVAHVDAVNAAFDDMTDQFNEQGFLSGPNQDKEAKKLYSKVHKYVVLVNAYTASAN